MAHFAELDENNVVLRVVVVNNRILLGQNDAVIVTRPEPVTVVSEITDTIDASSAVIEIIDANSGIPE
jgi:hypothetical protein